MTKDSKPATNAPPANLSNAGRRDFLKTSSAAALTAAVSGMFPSGVFAQTGGPEVKGTKIGYIALTDAAPLIIAKEKGFFTKYGLPDMDIAKQASWGATRDNMALGTKANGIDGAHILRPKIHMYTAGVTMPNNQPTPMYVLLNLNYDMQAISVASEYKDLGATTDSSKLKEAFAKKKAAGKEVKAAMTYPGGTHDLWLRYWLAAGGIDPDKDVSTIVVPPPQMVANMKVGNMDCFCVGEPWNEQLVNQNIGFTACTTGELWFRHPEKVLGMRAEWVDANPKATLAIMAATMEAQAWCEKMENKEEMSTILGRRQWFNVPVADIISRLRGDINYGAGRVAKGTNLFMKFWGENGDVSYPWKSLDTWFITENIRWGKFAPNTDIKALVDKTNRSDLWLEAARIAGFTKTPSGDSRGVEKFFDGKSFDPADPMAYLNSLNIKRIA